MMKAMKKRVTRVKRMVEQNLEGVG
jgi:hypothetical protein